MTFENNVVQWLYELRYRCESYDDCDSKNAKIMEPIYENRVWNSGERPKLLLRYGEECRVSVIFEGPVGDLEVLPLVFENLRLDVSDDVVMWRNELRYSCEGEKEHFLESEVNIRLDEKRE